ncbi:DUF6527 family protein [Mesorhizobium captivum]|uniref:DUF6527 family protein n=1 Tax=Mesorhizobium captivum TaxID=3072319 RepID=UPI002A23CF05|nr:DUF6527 family protein [Mesorhizobium sp. VK3C]MDX8449831.1 DUF6527 family protein [Mesorhizobium sp. VK3C]
MKTREIHQKGVVERQAEALELVKKPGDVAIVERGVVRSLVMRCPDGCGDILTVNLDGRAGPAWRLYDGKDGLTVFPSVWRDTGCGAHFIVWDDVIHWTNDIWIVRRDPILERAVEAKLTHDFISYVDLAAALDEIPWAVLDACRSLASTGAAVEDRDKRRPWFKLAGQDRRG